MGNLIFQLPLLLGRSAKLVVKTFFLLTFSAFPEWPSPTQFTAAEEIGGKEMAALNWIIGRLQQTVRDDATVATFAQSSANYREKVEF